MSFTASVSQNRVRLQAMMSLYRNGAREQIKDQTWCYPLLTMIHLELQPEIEAQLAVEAQARGLPLDRYIETIVAARSMAPAAGQALDEAQLARDLQQGLREIAEGNTLPARQVFAQLREEYDMRG